MPQVLGREAAVEIGRFQQGMAGESAVNTRNIDLTPGLFLEVLIAANVVGIGMGVQDGFQLPALLIQNLTDFSTGILIPTAVNEPHLVFILQIEADFHRNIDVIGPCTYLDEFIRGQFTLPGVFL